MILIDPSLYRSNGYVRLNLLDKPAESSSAFGLRNRILRCSALIADPTVEKCTYGATGIGCAVLQYSLARNPFASLYGVVRQLELFIVMEMLRGIASQDVRYDGLNNGTFVSVITSPLIDT